MPCTIEDFKTAARTYQCGGVSPYLNQYCEETGQQNWILTVDGSRPLSATISGYKGWDNKPPERAYADIIAGWQEGWELTREYCSKDDYWYWVMYPASLTTGIPLIWIAAGIAGIAVVYVLYKKLK